MSREQWGHGYHSGRNDASKKKKSGYVGLWFFTVKDDGMIEYQGQIKRRVDKDSWAVQHHEWMMGEANGPLVIVSLEQIKSFHLFEDAHDLRSGIHRYQIARPEMFPHASTEAFEQWEDTLRLMSGTSKKRSKKR